MRMLLRAQPPVLWGKFKQPLPLTQLPRRAAPNDREVPSHPPRREEPPAVYYPTDHKAVEEAHKPFEPIVEPGTKVGTEPIFQEYFEYLGLPEQPDQLLSTRKAKEEAVALEASRMALLSQKLADALYHIEQAEWETGTPSDVAPLAWAKNCITEAQQLVPAEPSPADLQGKQADWDQTGGSKVPGTPEKNEMFDDVGSNERGT